VTAGGETTGPAPRPDYRAVLDALSAQVAVVDGAGRIQAVNRAWLAFGTANGADPAVSGVGADYVAVARRSGAPEAWAVADAIEAVVAGTLAGYSGRYPCPGPRGPRWFTVHVSPLRAGPGDVPTGAVVEHVEVTRQRRTRAALLTMAYRDPLTGASNRRRLDSALPRMLERAARNGQPATVLALDFDRFKEVNDRFGHEVGDRALRAAAQVLRRVVRARDRVVRTGGDEFVVLCPAVGPAQALDVAGRLVRACRQELTLAGEGAIVPSVGVAIFPEHGTAPGSLLRAADAALYAAKRQGGGCRLWSADLTLPGGPVEP